MAPCRPNIRLHTRRLSVSRVMRLGKCSVSCIGWSSLPWLRESCTPVKKGEKRFFFRLESQAVDETWSPAPGMAANWQQQDVGILKWWYNVRSANRNPAVEPAFQIQELPRK